MKVTRLAAATSLLVSCAAVGISFTHRAPETRTVTIIEKGLAGPRGATGAGKRGPRGLPGVAGATGFQGAPGLDAAPVDTSDLEQSVSDLQVRVDEICSKGLLYNFAGFPATLRC